MKAIRTLSLLGIVLFLSHPTFACTIPVFRYALERWELGTYEVLIYHRGPLPGDVQAAIKPWTDGAAKGNVDITTIDLAGKLTPPQLKLWEREGDKDASAWMLVRVQSASAKEPSAWRGPCTAENLRGLLTSPLRQTLVTHLTEGASVVFILLTSDDAAADAQAHAMLRKQLPILEKQIKLPVQSEDGPKMRLPLALKVALPVLTLNRNDPAEAGFIRVLLATEEGLDMEKGPMLFPIFGRGRALAMYGRDFTKENVCAATELLCRDCSCQVKELNPGVDLLIAADWTRIFDEMFEAKDAKVAPRPIETPVSMPTADSPQQPNVSTPTIVPLKTWQTDSVSADEPVTTCCGLNVHFLLMAGAAGAAALVLVSGAWVLLRARK